MLTFHGIVMISAIDESGRGPAKIWAAGPRYTFRSPINTWPKPGDAFDAFEIEYFLKQPAEGQSQLAPGDIVEVSGYIQGSGHKMYNGEIKIFHALRAEHIQKLNEPEGFIDVGAHIEAVGKSYYSWRDGQDARELPQ